MSDVNAAIMGPRVRSRPASEPDPDARDEAPPVLPAKQSRKSAPAPAPARRSIRRSSKEKS